MTLTVGSLFAGIGGFDLGFERAGMRTEWFVEQDAYCQAVLRKHWPDVPIFDDVRAVGRDTLTPVDVLCGGFPCQDISAAGRGAGLDGERSGLWFEFERLIGELRPSYVVVENVPMLRTRGLDTVITGLACLGYDAEWSVVSAAEAGAPHLRKRIWIVAYPQCVELREQPRRGGRANRPSASLASVDGSTRSVADAECSQRWPGDPRGRGVARQDDGLPRGQEAAGRAAIGREDVADATRGGWEQEHPNGAGSTQRVGAGTRSGSTGSGEPADAGWWAVEPDVGRVAHGVPARMDRLRSLGNALVPQIAEEIGRRIMRAAA